MLRSANLAPLLTDFQRTNERVINTFAAMEATINKAGYTAQELQMAIPLVASDVQALLTSLSNNSGNIDTLINEIITSARTLNAPQSRKLRLAKFLLTVVIRGALQSLVTP
jgi:CRISPR/Cas system-associated endonuclease Cas3-HD